MQFVFLTYWDNLEAASLDIFHKRLVALHQFVFLGAWLASVYVAGHVLRGGRSGIKTAFHHGAQVGVDDVEVGVEVHLHLPELLFQLL